MDYYLVITTLDSAEKGRSIAKALVEERLAACVNLVPGIESFYIWDGALQEDREFLLLIKTDQKHLPLLQERLEALHPYEVPEILAFQIDRGAKSYLEWMDHLLGARR
ncbi:MAG: divalent-cation tolerance protein CutA [Nitratiruptor sp.]|nr:divalent-cation tolerance protein CutA [Nitratiruptor sp.]NPA83272.1 divalent-cation tolerance protein CutA [Campylobacterota bacterium]